MKDVLQNKDALIWRITLFMYTNNDSFVEKYVPDIDAIIYGIY